VRAESQVIDATQRGQVRSPPAESWTARRFWLRKLLACPAQLVSAQLMLLIGVRNAPEVPLGGTGGHRISVRIVFTTWSPLTESNRRPSPYHFSLPHCVLAGQRADLENASTHQHQQARHKHSRAQLATQSATQNDLQRAMRPPRPMPPGDAGCPVTVGSHRIGYRPTAPRPDRRIFVTGAEAVGEEDSLRLSNSVGIGHVIRKCSTVGVRDCYLNDLVVRRIFAAGLDLQAALLLIGNHCAGGRIHDAVGQLEEAVIDTHKTVSISARMLTPRRPASLSTETSIAKG
jgi:hypothetical protein